MPQKIHEIAEDIWEKYVVPIGKVGLTLFGVQIGVKAAYTVLTSFVLSTFGIKLPDLPY